MRSLFHFSDLALAKNHTQIGEYQMKIWLTLSMLNTYYNGVDD